MSEVISRNQAREAFENLFGRAVATGRDDEWAAFRKGWNTATMLAVSECQAKMDDYHGAAAQTHRRLLRNLSASIVSAKALEKP